MDWHNQVEKVFTLGSSSLNHSNNGNGNLNHSNNGNGK